MVIININVHLADKCERYRSYFFLQLYNYLCLSFNISLLKLSQYVDN